MHPLWRTAWRFLKTLKTELPDDPETPLLGIYLEKTIIVKDTCSPGLAAALFTVAKTWTRPACPSAVEWRKKHSAHGDTTQPRKGRADGPAVTSVGPEMSTLCNVSQTKTQTSLICEI